MKQISNSEILFNPFMLYGRKQSSLPQATANCNFIGTGYNNKLTAASSVVLGGSNNSDGGQANMAIYGNGITASSIFGGLGAVWAHELVLVNIPMGNIGATPPFGYPLGSLYYFPDGAGNNVVYVV
jgi:hypothetical protein